MDDPRKESRRMPVLRPDGRPRIIPSHLPAIGNDHRLRSFTALRANALDLLHDIHALNDGAEDDMLAVEPRSLHGAKEKLRAVRVRPGVRHGENAWAGVFPH